MAAVLVATPFVVPRTPERKEQPVVHAVVTLVFLLAGGALWWRISLERWRRALAAEQVARHRDHFVAQTRYQLLEHSTGQLHRALGQQPGLEPDVDFMLWEGDSDDRHR